MNDTQCYNFVFIFLISSRKLSGLMTLDSSTTRRILHSFSEFISKNVCERGFYHVITYAACETFLDLPSLYVQEFLKTTQRIFKLLTA